jgi:hypothetical protein
MIRFKLTDDLREIDGSNAPSAPVPRNRGTVWIEQAPLRVGRFRYTDSRARMHLRNWLARHD